MAAPPLAAGTAEATLELMADLYRQAASSAGHAMVLEARVAELEAEVEQLRAELTHTIPPTPPTS